WSEVEAVARPGTLHVVLWAPADERAARTALVVIDRAGFGIVAPVGEPRRYRIQPASPAAVWAELCALVGRLPSARNAPLSRP
ncbi:MAG: hypothetical protein ACRD0U_09435, partial [Acidimicrobiales bacterium]